MTEILDAEFTEVLPAVRGSSLPSERTPGELVARLDAVREAMQQVMRKDEHYGVIPGTDKPTLLKPGAEVLCAQFMFDPEYHSEREYRGDHLMVFTTCTLYHIPTEKRVASGEASCSTLEERYRYRNASRACPACHKDAIIKGNAQFGGGWVCWKKKDGCGAKYADGDPAIESQQVGKVEHPNPPDLWNTVIKMSNKRALIAAVLNATGASDVFTQDMEDEPEQPPPPPPPDPPKPRARAKKDDTPEAGSQFVAPEGATATLIDADQRRELAEAAGTHGVSVDRMKQIIKNVGGVDSSAELTVEKFADVMAQVETESLPFS